MKITDKKVVEELEKHGLWNVWDRIEDFPENEVFGRSDMDIFKQELEHTLYSFETSGYGLNESLREARRILKVTKYGREILIWEGSNKPVYRNSDIRCAKECVNEYNRTKSMAKRLGII